MKPYVIKQGDYLLKVAHLRGFDPDAVWSDPKNEPPDELRETQLMLRRLGVLMALAMVLAMIVIGLSG